MPSQFKAYRIGLGRQKNRAAHEYMSMNLKEMQILCKKLFAEYTKVKWQNCCSHMKKLKEVYWQ
jgi:hypothetical protein